MKKVILDELKAAGMSGAEAEHAFREVSTAIARAVRRGDRVRLPQVGTLVRTTRAATRRKSLVSDELISIGERDVVALRNPEKF